MARTLLELYQDFCNEVGLTPSTLVVGAGDQQTRQVLALAHREGQEMLDSYWSRLHKEYTFNTVAGQADYPLPADFECFINATFWDGSKRWELLGPISAQEKNVLRYGTTASGPRLKFYIRVNRMYLDPTPTVSGDQIAYDYLSNQWILAADGTTTKERFTADTDTILLPEKPFVLGLIWRFKSAKGLDYTQEKATYDAALSNEIARDGGKPDLNLSGSAIGFRLLDNNNLPDTGYGQ